MCRACFSEVAFGLSRAPTPTNGVSDGVWLNPSGGAGMSSGEVDPGPGEVTLGE